MVRLRAVWVGVVVRCLALCGRALHAAAGLVVLWGGSAAGFAGCCLGVVARCRAVWWGAMQLWAGCGAGWPVGGVGFLAPVT